MENNNKYSEIYSETLPTIRKFEDFSKGKKHTMMNYLKVSYITRLTGLPTNGEFGLENWVDVRTRLFGEDELYIAQLNSMESTDSAGKKYPTYNPSEILVKIMARCITDWSFVDNETGSKYAVNEVNLRGLIREDFDYLAAQFNDILSGPQTKEVDDTQPLLGLTEDEKKVSNTNSTSESDKSEQEAKEISVLG